MTRRDAAWLNIIYTKCFMQNPIYRRGTAPSHSTVSHAQRSAKFITLSVAFSLRPPWSSNL